MNFFSLILKKTRILNVFFLFICSCQSTGVYLKENSSSLTDIRKTIVSLSGELRFISQNGRELLTRYYDRDMIVILSMDKAKERFFTQYTILGDRRPYDIQVKVFREIKKLNGDFEDSQLDFKRSERAAEDLERGLNEARKKNILDDFRSF